MTGIVIFIALPVTLLIAAVFIARSWIDRMQQPLSPFELQERRRHRPF